MTQGSSSEDKNGSGRSAAPASDSNSDVLKLFNPDESSGGGSQTDIPLPHSASMGSAGTNAPQAAFEPTMLEANAPPRVLGGYELVQQLGAGGMGEVWLAYERNLERYVAIKTMRRALAQNEEAIQRFYREARAVARLNHPGIIHIYQIGEEAGLLYFAMERVEGESLSDRLRQSGPLSPAFAFELMAQIVDALGFACAQGIIHRDIKPANVLLDRNVRPKLADFGLAKIIESDSQMTATGASMGSPSYMSPEVARGQNCDHRGDIYSLGITLFQMLTGDVPHKASTPVAILLKHIEEPLPEPPELQVIAGGALMAFLNRMTAKRPEDRFQIYGELAAGIAQLRAAGLPDQPAFAASGIWRADSVSTPSPGQLPVFGGGETMGRPAVQAPPLTPYSATMMTAPTPGMTPTVQYPPMQMIPPAPAPSHPPAIVHVMRAIVSLAVIALIGYIVTIKSSPKSISRNDNPRSEQARGGTSGAPGAPNAPEGPASDRRGRRAFPAAREFDSLTSTGTPPGRASERERAPIPSWVRDYFDGKLPMRERYDFAGGVRAINEVLQRKDLPNPTRQKLLQIGESLDALSRFRSAVTEAAKKPNVHATLIRPNQPPLTLTSATVETFTFVDPAGTQVTYHWRDLMPMEVIQLASQLMERRSHEAEFEDFEAFFERNKLADIEGVGLGSGPGGGGIGAGGAGGGGGIRARLRGEAGRGGGVPDSLTSGAVIQRPANLPRR